MSFLIAIYKHSTFVYFPFPARRIDVLQRLEVSENMEGVSLVTGLCTSRTGTQGKDQAYKIDKKVQLSVPTNQLFPGNTLTIIIYTVVSTKHNIIIWKISSSVGLFWLHEFESVCFY